MTEQTKVRRGGLDWNVPNDGKAADAYAVAQTVLALESRRRNRPDHETPLTPWDTARHATRLHVISGLLHRLAERQCNEDLACMKCGGEGQYDVWPAGREIGLGPGKRDCEACAGTGSSLGRKLKSLKADAQEIAEHYGLSCSFGGLVDGGLVIGTPEQLDRVDPERHGHVIRRLGQ